MQYKMLVMSALMSLILSLQAQRATQPSIMVIPNDGWCIEKGYTVEFTDAFSGTTREVPDYRKAVNDQELIAVIAKINEMFSERGFPLVNMQSALQKIESDRAVEDIINNRSGAGVGQSPLDQLNATAGADINLVVTWIVNKVGPKKSVTFTLQALDAYTSKQVGGASGTGPQMMSTELPVMLQEAVLSHVDNLQAQMSSHFDDLRTNGREVRVRIMVWNDAPVYLDDECGGTEYIDLISDWMFDNTVNGAFSEGDVTETRMELDFVRIPLYDDRGRPINTRRFGRQLSRYLEKTCSDMDDTGIKVISRGLGEVWLLLGGK